MKRKKNSFSLLCCAGSINIEREKLNCLCCNQSPTVAIFCHFPFATRRCKNKTNFWSICVVIITELFQQCNVQFSIFFFIFRFLSWIQENGIQCISSFFNILLSYHLKIYFIFHSISMHTQIFFIRFYYFWCVYKFMFIYILSKHFSVKSSWNVPLDTWKCLLLYRFEWKISNNNDSQYLPCWNWFEWSVSYFHLIQIT